MTLVCLCEGDADEICRRAIIEQNLILKVKFEKQHCYHMQIMILFAYDISGGDEYVNITRIDKTICGFEKSLC